ncbi:MAG: Clp protease N-terminal domain-containing protein, partial [Syntrophomonadaceae bacterium]|nr:Clp protease N-terminal domain-containing protein [Syntrophomonadaceae bacterium]
MDLNRYTQKSREAIAAAQQTAQERHHQEVGARHLVQALLAQESGLATRLLTHMGVDTAGFSRQLERLLDQLPAVHGYTDTLRMSPALARVLAQAEREAQALKDDYVSVEHLLLAALEEGEPDLKAA